VPDSSLLQRLKERKLVQWALAYLAGAFVVFQLLDALDEALGLSTGTHQAILALVVVGFFITLILAWYHGEKGRQRVSGPELLMVAALLVVAGVALSMLRGGEEGREPAKTAPITTVVDDRPSIAVLPFDNFSPSPDDA
jgi:serine/threonine-protein kinase